MSDRFSPIAADQLFEWVFAELETRDSIFGIPRRHFFVPSERDRFQTAAFGHPLETPFGPAAGPHTQMAQNIVAAWLCGARYIELKTVQTLDELDVSKPCIDMEDEGYNVEWSQELKIHQSFDEYLRAWVLIHALHHKLGFPGTSPGVVFNLSVGYDLAGIRQPNMQWFLNRMQDCSGDKAAMIEELARFHPAAADLVIPDCISDSVTLSTMHGCPPGEIENICEYLLRDRRLHTFVKCNPTLLGAERVRHILNDDLGFRDVVVPDAAFEHDLEYRDALPLLTRLRGTAEACGLAFGVKLTNTLEVGNFKTVFDGSEKTMYLSGRPLHAITVNLAADLAEEFSGRLPMSFSAGADCFNAPHLLGAGMQTITVCSDLLKTGGYLRLPQYLECTDDAFRRAGAASTDEFILNTAGPAACGDDVRLSTLANLHRYAAQCRQDPLLSKDRFDTSHSKTGRKLGLFDCIEAPCMDGCAVDQKVPHYMGAVREGDYERAARLTRSDNPIPAMLARVCDHLCEPVCIRTHLDEPLAIRHIKRFIVEHENGAAMVDSASTPARPAPDGRVAIIGAGPAGMAAAVELAQAGIGVEIFEMHPYAGGMVGGAIPEYRLPASVMQRDLATLENLGVRIHYNTAAGRDVHLSQLRRDGFRQVIIAAGAQIGKKLGLEGEDCDGVMDALYFLRHSREGRPVPTGTRIGVIGAGDTAMDCARTAWRLSAGRPGSRVTLIYRRTIDQMPADREEVHCLREEGIEVLELAKPQRLLVEDGKLRGLVCRRMEYRGDFDGSGRKIPHEVPGSDFEVPLDTLILAISQHALLDFFDEEPVAVNRRGYIEADPVTFATSVPGIYAGGDVVNDGPSSIVEAAADGKAIAQAIARDILGRENHRRLPPGVEPFDPADLLQRRGHREWRVPIPLSPVRERRNFAEVVQPYTEQQARAEAARCLDCHTYCSLCVGVCPNLALQTIRVRPFAARLPALKCADGAIQARYGASSESGPNGHFRVDQVFQIALLADLCNECGNCTTFCPTAGEPYRDKPRLYLDRAEFDAQQDNAFMAFGPEAAGAVNGWAMDARWGGTTHRIELYENGDGRRLDYRGPAFRARIDPASFQIEDIEAAAAAENAKSLSLEPCAAMFVLLQGIRVSVPHLPTARSMP
jgi:putative selenate reductase